MLYTTLLQSFIECSEIWQLDDLLIEINIFSVTW